MQVMNGVAPVRQLTGRHVQNRSGEHLGVIEDLVIDLASGNVVYAVLEFGGFLGIGNKLFAVPWDAISIEGDTFVVDATRKELEESPGFDPDHWPERA